MELGVSMKKSIEENNRAAEAYFSNPPDPLRFVRKPFQLVEEASSIFLRLGIILQELYAGPSHRVVDFGAGSCWLSRMLNRLGFSTVSVDVSISALNIGRRLFESEPYINQEVKSEFLIFDGYHLNLSDASVDRVIGFDVYHHLPNPKNVLAELCRVLVPGGIAAFAEPGIEHSLSHDSCCETETYGVLENDVNLDHVWQEAKTAGFTDIKIAPIIMAQDMALELTAYSSYLNGNNEIFPHNQNRQYLHGGQVFFLYKGPFHIDSRAPAKLLATLRLQGELRKKVRIGERIWFRLEAANTSETIWKAGPYVQGGFVQLGGHLEKLRNEDIASNLTEMICFDFLRVPLKQDVAPKDTVRFESSFQAPSQPGIYRVTFDMVDEHIKWFAQDKSQTVSLLVMVDNS